MRDTTLCSEKIYDPSERPPAVDVYSVNSRAILEPPTYSKTVRDTIIVAAEVE